jgi:dTDP-4-dehydrorhamnose 3,5-epimerase
MNFTETKLKGAYLVELQKLEDERGFFARSWCQREFNEHGLDPNLVQCDISFNKQRGTLRGMHFQLPPFEESKLVRCTRGSVYDVMVDLRPVSETFLQWVAVELTANNYRSVFIPKRFAHGFLTLEDETEVFYLISEFYAPDYSYGLRWDDPLLNVNWPIPIQIISDKDHNFEDTNPEKIRNIFSS